MSSTSQKILGIDYGSKRIGLALSEVESSLAFPYQVIENKGSAKVLANLLNIINENEVVTVVIGESLNLDGDDNEVMKQIRVLIKLLKESKPDVDIHLEPEHYSSFEAERWSGKHDKIDASAAAIILQAWIDRDTFNRRKMS